MGNIDFLPRKLNHNNIEESILEYKRRLNEIPLNIKASSLLELMNILKRNKIGKGPYPNVTIFEAANRIMTDLVVLGGVRLLLNRIIHDINFDEYTVEYGNEDNNAHDITAFCNGITLKCEVFNVAELFFQTKKAKSLSKLRKNKNDKDLLLIMYNKDAVSTNYQPKQVSSEYYLAVDIEEV